jgi:YD repeat-containing protein
LLWGHYKLFPIAQVTNSLATQSAFTSFDEPDGTEGGWDVSGTTTSDAAKTGTKSLKTGNTISKGNLPNGDYVVGFWAKVISGSSGSVTVNGAVTNITDPNWKFYTIAKSGTSISFSNSNVYVDELRLHPAGAQMTSFTYKPLVGMTSQTDANGNVTYFEYDANGRLLFVKDNDGNILKSHQYKYFTN